MEDAQEERKRKTAERGLRESPARRAAQDWKLVGSGRRMATDRCSGAQGRALVYAGSARLRGTPLRQVGGRGLGAGALTRQDWSRGISGGASNWPGAAPERQAAGAVETRSG